MKVIIIGAGIGGLSAYHSLRKNLADATPPLIIKIYESHSSPASATSNVGGGLGLAPNGLRAIASVSPSAAAYVQEHGFPGAITAFRNSTGRLLGHYWNGRQERYGFGQLMLRRTVVHEALLQGIPTDAIEWGTKVKSVRETSGGVTVEFFDGRSEGADLIIGADGVRSMVREAVFGNKYPAEYDGLTGVGGFVPLSSLSARFRDSLPTEGVSMTFGPHGFFGYSMCSPLRAGDLADQSIQWWSIYEASTPPKRDEDHSDVRTQLLARHGTWKSPYDAPDAPLFQNIIMAGCDDLGQSADTLLILPRYITPRIPHWSSLSGSGKIILLGDAAHAMPPDSGQGVSCAVEDSATIGLLLKHYSISRGLDLAEAFKRTAKAYEAIRMERVWYILDVAKRNGNSKKKQSWWQEWIRDRILWLLCKLPESINDRLFAYDVGRAVDEYLSKFEPEH